MYKIIDKQTEWDRFVVEQGGHPLQLWAWGEVKSAHGPWSPVRILFQNGDEIVGGAQVLQRKMPKPFGKMLYVPRGGFGSPKQRSELLKELGAWAKEQGGVELKIEPDWTLAGKLPEMKGWRKSKNRILLARTLRLDLTKTEDELLADMSKKTRQYIRKSEKDGVQIQRISDKKDLLTALKIYKETAERDGFSLHGDSYYLDIAIFGGDFIQ
ncbi:MAG: aminoacyltransferase, partial [Candidatus Nomurabacteria bacterium]|nr:aminoacyltransferase [Candidatus Nomurabacteria bacterium]